MNRLLAKLWQNFSSCLHARGDEPFVADDPPGRPNRTNRVIDAIARRYELDPEKASLIFIRSYYLNSMGVSGVGDSNIYDDACYLISPAMRESYNANTEASFPKKKDKNGRYPAVMKLGKYKYAKGIPNKSKPGRQFRALCPPPVWMSLPCTRNGVTSTCSHTNIHKGGSNAGAFDRVWSLGCFTIPNIQWEDFTERVYSNMTKYKQKTIDVMIVENVMRDGEQVVVDHEGRKIVVGKEPDQPFV